MKDLISAFYLPILFFSFVIIASSCEKASDDITTTDFKNVKDPHENHKSRNFILITSSSSQIEAEFSNFDFNYHLIGSIINGQSISTLKVFDQLSNKEVYSHNFILKMEDVHYKTFSRNQLVESANSISDSLELTSTDLNQIIDDVNEFSIKIFTNLASSLQFSEISQGIFYQKSILKMLARKISESSASCECSTYDKYLIDEGTFTCNEDLFFPSEHVAEYYQLSYNIFDSLVLDSLGIQYVISNALSKPRTWISQKQIEDIVLSRSIVTSQIVVDENTQTLQLIGCTASSGGALGCCGNYPGPCRRCRIICLMHDLACWSCFSGVFCGPDCVPE